MRISGIVLLLSLASTAAAQEAPKADEKIAGLPEGGMETLKKGEVVVTQEMFKNEKGEDMGRGVAFIIINKPWGEAFDTLVKYEEQPDYMPRLKECKVVKKDGDTWYVFHKIKVLLVNVAYTLKMGLKRAEKTVTWDVDEGSEHDIRDTEGKWIFYPVDGGQKTVVSYGVYVDTGRMVPQFVQDFLTKRDLPDVLKNFRSRVESGGKWKK